MADKTKIAWCDATVNFWWGCTKVGPGCDHCYAETWDRRLGGAHWGTGVPRRKIKSAVNTMHRLDNKYAAFAADIECARGNAAAFGLPLPRPGPRRRVFIQSMSDLFDLEAPVEWFAEAWRTIEACDRLEIQILTKRVSAVEKRLAAIGRTEWPLHAGLMITVVTQDEADRDVPRLLALKEKLAIPWVGLSCEPLLGSIDLTTIDVSGDDEIAPLGWGWLNRLEFGQEECTRLDWIVAGDESGPNRRESSYEWSRFLMRQCKAAGVPFFMKQLQDPANGKRILHDLEQFPEDLRIREYPR